MANLQAGEASSSSNVSAESSDSMFKLNIKTPDSQIYSFNIDKNIAVSVFKEKIASQIGIPVQQQLLTFRRRVLRDNDLLSEYNVANGDTLHVLERPPQPTPGPNTAPFVRAQDSASVVPPNVVFGRSNAGEPEEAAASDLRRAFQGNGTGSRSNAGGQNQAGHQLIHLQGVHGQSTSPIAVPSLNMPIPDSLTTITEFIHQMELVLSQNGNRQDQPPTASSNSRAPEMPRNSGGYPTIEALNIVLQRAQHLLCNTAASALSITATRLVQERGSNDPSVREQVQIETVHLGVDMQYLGALLLELGRTISTLHLGQYPAQSFLNAGPAVYISPSGPNPIMVQPFPLQSSSLFETSNRVASSPVSIGAVGVGNDPRNVNIHIHSDNRAPSGEYVRGERTNRTVQPSPGVSSGVPSRPALVSTSTFITLLSESSAGVPQILTLSRNSTFPIFADRYSQLRRMPANRQNENDTPPEGSVHQDQPLGCSQEDDLSFQQRNLSCNRIGETNSILPNDATIDGQGKTETSTSSQVGRNNVSIVSDHAESHKVLAGSSHSNDNPDGSSSSQDTSDISRGGIGSAPEARHDYEDHSDVVDAIAQVLHSPSMDGLLAGVSQQTGIGSPDLFRNIFQQFTQNPAMRSTLNQMAQQMEDHNLGRGQGGGIDFSGLMQQMLPIVSQALGGISSVSQPNTPSQSVPFENSSRRDMPPVVQRLEHQTSPHALFRSVAERALQLFSGGSEEEEHILNDICSGLLAQEFVDMLLLDISRRLQNETGS